MLDQNHSLKYLNLGDLFYNHAYEDYGRFANYPEKRFVLRHHDDFFQYRYALIENPHLFNVSLTKKQLSAYYKNVEYWKILKMRISSLKDITIGFE